MICCTVQTQMLHSASHACRVGQCAFRVGFQWIWLEKNLHIFKDVFLSPFAILIGEYFVQSFSVGLGHDCFKASSITYVKRLSGILNL